ncbi:MAG: glycoside hydrolase family 2 TIM barrel-domain containing protein [Bacteroides sp.]|uniref:glycoside hydrolase family 2 protein n=1 Tax=Bacteroides sp. TaxID=29523 RepID=UPI002FCBFA3F
MKTLYLYLTLLLIGILPAQSAYQPTYSVAGFYPIENTGREVYSMNPAWRFYKGAQPEAWQPNFDDSTWTVVSLPDGMEYLPTEASGCVNYQGEAWYRKHFTPDNQLKGKKLFLHFEAIMGKSKVWINGKLVNEHFGGFLPVIADITPYIQFGQDNVIAVCADNSDDPSYPPGKPQDVLDFSYFGGIYRDCWLIAHNNVFITDPNYENSTAGGGLFVAYDRVSEQSADVLLKLHVRNEQPTSFSGKVIYELHDANGQKVAGTTQSISIGKQKATHASQKLKLSNPHLWSPDAPYLYQLHVLIKDNKGNIVDGYRRRIGVRSIEFKGKDGFWLNGKPYETPLIGANRHQDFAVVGNALSNSLHWRDAKKLRDAGLKVIRNAHYPQDPAFMDACDELGLFVIVNTPGWQFWNEAPIFAQRVYSDIRNMVRRDRNHPSVWMWEPILNETWYPADFAKKVQDIVNEEYPYPYCYTACDATAKGSEHYPILFTHPQTGDKGWGVDVLDPKITYFTREWGDNVDDWNSHNSPSRVNRAWGETPMLIQAEGYAKPTYPYTCYESLYLTTRQHVGGCLWHSFDHQRGYHPDPFYGGLMDVFRQPKYSYQMFKAQRSPEKSDLIAETGPMVYIAHEMTPFSPKDVTVYSNCDEVRLTMFQGGKQYLYKKEVREKGMPSPTIIFKDVFNVMDDKNLSRKKRQSEVFMLAEGIIDGKVVATHKVTPARRPSKVILWADNEGMNFEANGSDLVTVVAAIADGNGNIKRLNNYFIRFEIEGEGTILGDESIMANPHPIQWGTAPILVKSTTRPGKIRIKASVLLDGKQMPVAGTLELESTPTTRPLVFSEQEEAQTNLHSTKQESTLKQKENCADEIKKLQMELNRYKLKEVEKQQTEFGEGI